MTATLVWWFLITQGGMSTRTTTLGPFMTWEECMRQSQIAKIGGVVGPCYEAPLITEPSKKQ
jgi:hypothetical protein